jgi:hypothetical protein
MTPFPLAWPENMPRHKGVREAGAFRSALSASLENAKKSLEAFARDTGMAASNIVFSSNVGGLMSGTPADPGIALWFTWDGEQRCIAVDRYSKPEANLQAIHHILEADRTKLRHGSLSIVRAALDRAARAPDPSRDGVVEALRDMLANWSPTMSNYAPSRNRARAVISAIEAAK